MKTEKALMDEWTQRLITRTWRGGLVREIRRFKEKRETAGDGATAPSVKVFQLGNVGDAEERKLSGWNISESGPKNSYVPKSKWLIEGTS